jgi:hypothetical protein
VIGHRLVSHGQGIIDDEERGALVLSKDRGGLDRRQEIASRDPLVTSDLRAFEICEWQLMEGSIAVKANYSTGTFEIA